MRSNLLNEASNIPTKPTSKAPAPARNRSGRFALCIADAIGSSGSSRTKPRKPHKLAHRTKTNGIKQLGINDKFGNARAQFTKCKRKRKMRGNSAHAERLQVSPGQIQHQRAGLGGQIQRTANHNPFASGFEIGRASCRERV